jgi:hypothetical protein
LPPVLRPSDFVKFCTFLVIFAFVFVSFGTSNRLRHCYLVRSRGETLFASNCVCVFFKFVTIARDVDRMRSDQIWRSEGFSFFFWPLDKKNVIAWLRKNFKLDYNDFKKIQLWKEKEENDMAIKFSFTICSVSVISYFLLKQSAENCGQREFCLNSGVKFFFLFNCWICLQMGIPKLNRETKSYSIIKPTLDPSNLSETLPLSDNIFKYFPFYDIKDDLIP